MKILFNLCFLIHLTSILASVATTVEFPDAVLEAAVRTALGKPTGELTDVDLAALIELHAEPRSSNTENAIQSL